MCSYASSYVSIAVLSGIGPLVACTKFSILVPTNLQWSQGIRVDLSGEEPDAVRVLRGVLLGGHHRDLLLQEQRWLQRSCRPCGGNGRGLRIQRRVSDSASPS